MPKTPIRELPHAPVANTVLNPAGWPQPKGYANGIKARGEMVFTGGMVGWDEKRKISEGFVAQTRQALKNIAAVLAAGGATPEHIVRMTWYVVDIEEYRSALPQIGAAYREIMGRHFPGHGPGRSERAGRADGAAGNRGDRGDPGLGHRSGAVSLRIPRKNHKKSFDLAPVCL